VILAVAGQKKWKFIDDSEEEEKFQTLVLEPSDGIFIPRGLIHKAQCLSEDCMHISFAYDPSGFFSQFWRKDRDSRASDVLEKRVDEGR
jgi:ribosomal protein L16 Arg81 hydroxylase